jgi:two-component system nitrogen regulation response regulator GlnG
MTRILILDDDVAVLNCFRVLLTQTRRFQVEVLADSSRALETIAAGKFDLLLLDMDMPVVSGMEVLRSVRRDHPSLEVVVITGVGDVEMAVESMKLGAFDYLCKPVGPERLVGCLDRAVERSRRDEELRRAREGGSLHGPRFHEAFKDFVTQDPALMRTLSEVERIALSNNSVLIRGESGTGKELVARAIHQIGCRSDKPFIAVNASAFAAALFDSEFFGHERGAFTGADSFRPGFFEEADGGTLFLDEIGDIELPVQSKLLRVLQGGEFYRLGSSRKRSADVRIIAATNTDLDRQMEAGRFRRDLFYRLRVTSSCWPTTSSTGTPRPTARPSTPSPRARWRSSRRTTSRATCASWRTSSPAPWCWRPAERWAWTPCPRSFVPRRPGTERRPEAVAARWPTWRPSTSGRSWSTRVGTAAPRRGSWASRAWACSPS